MARCDNLRALNAFFPVAAQKRALLAMPQFITCLE